MNSYHAFMILLLFTRLLCVSIVVQGAAAAYGNDTDRAALLEFKGQVSDDPDGVLSSWNDTVHFCRWLGVTCSRRRPRITELVLPDSRLGGSLSPYIGNLSFLRILNLNNNGFAGEIPPEIGNLRRLTELLMDNNSFSGQLPDNISGCTSLQEIRLGNSQLIGEIPRGLSALSELRVFLVHKNHFTGMFPAFFGNFSSLEILGGNYNEFSGPIPASLGRLRRLRQIYLGANFFSGTVPTSIFNLTSLFIMELVLNKLKGGLPPDIGITLPNLQNFHFSGNQLTGPIPPSIANATNLRSLQLTQNNFTGSVPDLRNLNQLSWVGIADNQLGNDSSGDLKFLESLNSTDLTLLEFSLNNFGGTLPRSIGNLSSNLNKLQFWSNRLTGTLPPSIGNLHNLEYLDISLNPLTGMLPKEIGDLHKLKHLQADYNIYSGKIPSSLGNLTKLMILTLRGSGFNGTIPSSLGKCQNLIGLDLSENNLSGIIPPQVLGISSLSNYLFLSHNKLTGAMPNEVGVLMSLAILEMHGNRLSGQVPNSLGGCTSLVSLDIGNNMFEGNISAFLSPLKGLQQLDLSQNNFFGGIPKFLGEYHLTYLNLSFNHFEGEVPNKGVFLNVTRASVLGNYKLCGGIPALNLPRCPTSKLKHRRKRMLSKIIIAITSGLAVLFVLLLLIALHRYMDKKGRRNLKLQSGLVPKRPFPQISYEDILGATGGLNQENLIAAGGFGSVFKGILGDSDNVVAIKVLDLRNQAALKSFMAECEVLKQIRHRNLVKICTLCSTIDFRGNDFKALVYEYMENGSLDDWLHPKVTPEGVHRQLSLRHRLSIAVDIACAVEYLHHESDVRVIHCDLKPSNVLLDAEMTAKIGDFGLTRILSADDVIGQLSSTGARGTVGYSPPEYGMGRQVSREGDVYSFGILLLEMFTGKKPTDDMFQDACNIRSHCEAALPERAGEVADPCLFQNEFGIGSSARAPRRILECLAKVFEIGVVCCSELPGERMDIHVAATKLRSLKSLVG